MNPRTKSNVKKFFTVAAYASAPVFLYFNIKKQRADWRKMDEEYKALGLPSPRPFAQQTAKQQEETIKFMKETNGCSDVQINMMFGRPTLECIRGEKKPEGKSKEEVIFNKKEVSLRTDADVNRDAQCSFKK